MNQQRNPGAWKKIFPAVSCLLVLVCALSACMPVVVVKGDSQMEAPATDQPVENSSAQQSETRVPASNQSSGKLTDLLELVDLPAEYLISYEILENGVIRTITKGQDKNGNIYYCSGSEECYYALEEGRYRLYKPDENGIFAADTSALYTAEHIDTTTSEFNEYLEQSNMQYNGVASLTGTEEIAGRTCDVYQFEVTVINFSNHYKLAIDQETGACMLWQQITDVSGHVTSQSGSFQCVQFTTKNVELPIN